MANSPDDEIVHRNLDTEMGEPVTQVAEIVADLEDKRHEDLKPAYEQIDSVLEEIFSNPPRPEAQVEIVFTYEGYRITVEQDGSTRLVRVN